ncbi:histidine--tRNA ligase [Patescibacteria group bacterium]|nr:histidine--tRNA ligase [Patescibacteria group bacterium]
MKNDSVKFKKELSLGQKGCSLRKQSDGKGATQPHFLSTGPYKGTRDFYPADMSVRNYMFDTLSRVVEQYGYVEYDAPLLEETALYKAKTGEEIVNEQTYSFTDRGGRDVTIRPEMTPTVARMVARRRKSLSFPLRWYSIPNLFRYERPQRGRIREHWQLNVDIFGIDSVSADIEIIAVAYDILRAFGATDNDFQIRVNSRQLINFLLNDFLKVKNEHAHTLSKLIDKKAKITEKEFEAQAKEILGAKTAVFIDFLNNKDIDNLPKEFETNQGAQDLKKLFQMLNELNITNIVYDSTIMRGFDYYTGIVFEVYDTNKKNNRSLFGGGRYDNLVDIFGVEKVSGVGFGMGDVTLLDYLTTHKLLPINLRSDTNLYICVCAEKYEKDANILARYLRARDIGIVLDITNRKISAQIKTAVNANIPFSICIGEDEIRSGQYKLKMLSSREEKLVSKEEIIQIILGRLKQ